MANKTEERLLNVFSEASGKSPGGARASDADEMLTAGERSRADSAAEYTSAPPKRPRSARRSMAEPARAITERRDRPAPASSSSGGGIGSTLESVAGSVFGGALGLVPLVGSLFGLFGSKSTQQPAFQKYENAVFDFVRSGRYRRAASPMLTTAKWDCRVYTTVRIRGQLGRKWREQRLGGHQHLRGVQRASGIQQSGSLQRFSWRCYRRRRRLQYAAN